MPRLPENWDMRISSFPVGVLDRSHTLRSQDGKYTLCNMDVGMTYPVNGRQSVSLIVRSGCTIRNAKIRVGPFRYGTASVNSIIGGTLFEKTCFNSGDSAWAWVELDDLYLNQPVEIFIKY